MQRKKTGAIIIAFCIALPGIVSAQFREYKRDRITISADGYSAPDDQHKWPTGDPDDWEALPAMLGVLAKTGLQEQLVHCSYNNFIEAPAVPDGQNQMKIGVDHQSIQIQ